VHSAVRPGSQALSELFQRDRAGARSILANDTSIGVGYAPLSALEFLVLRTENLLNGRPRASCHPAWGEDIKVMGIRQGSAVSLTIACAMIDRCLASIDEYLAETTAIRRKVQDLAAEHGFDECRLALPDGDGNLGRSGRRRRGRSRQQGERPDHALPSDEPGSRGRQEPGHSCRQDLQHLGPRHR
jgi:S-adenosylmethionine synthetase